MLDFFSILTKGGLVLWYFQAEALQLNTIQAAINDLIKYAIIDVSRLLVTVLYYSRLVTVGWL